MNCDVCGRNFRPEAGQVTADTILCGECAARVREGAAEVVRDVVRTPDPGFAEDVKASGPPEAAELIRRIESGEIGPHSFDLGGEG